MIVCHCHIVTDKDIIKLVKKGYKTLKDVRCCTGACTDCGGCKKAILDILKKSDKKPVQSEKNDD